MITANGYDILYDNHYAMFIRGVTTFTFTTDHKKSAFAKAVEWAWKVDEKPTLWSVK